MAVTLQKQSPPLSAVLWRWAFLIITAASQLSPHSSSPISCVCGCSSHLLSWLMLSFSPPDQQGSYVYLHAPGHRGSARCPLLNHKTQLWSLLHLPGWDATCPADSCHHKQSRQRRQVGLHMFIRSSPILCQTQQCPSCPSCSGHGVSQSISPG